MSCTFATRTRCTVFNSRLHKFAVFSYVRLFQPPIVYKDAHRKRLTQLHQMANTRTGHSATDSRGLPRQPDARDVGGRHRLVNNAIDSRSYTNDSSMSKSKGIKSYQKPDFSLSVEDRVRALYRELADNPDYEGFDTQCLRQAKFLSASVEKTATTWEFTVTRRFVVPCSRNSASSRRVIPLSMSVPGDIFAEHLS